jgi:nicotinamide riboside transporter PnuC
MSVTNFFYDGYAAALLVSLLFLIVRWGVSLYPFSKREDEKSLKEEKRQGLNNKEGKDMN